MSKKIWSIEEEKFVCKAYLKELVCCNDYARFVGHEMVEAGFEERSVGSIVAKLNDYRKIHNRLDLSHVSSKSKKAYIELFVKENLNIENISGFINSLNDNDQIETTLDISTGFKSGLSNFMEVPNLPKAERINRDYRYTFTKFLEKLMEDRGITKHHYSKIYNPVGMSRKTFDKLKNGESLSKENLLQLAFSFKFSLEETVDFLSIIHASFSSRSRFDQIIIFFLEKKIYDIFEIDATLYAYGEATLFT